MPLIILSFPHLLMAALQVWHYRSWQPLWVLGAISAITLLGLGAWLAVG